MIPPGLKEYFPSPAERERGWGEGNATNCYAVLSHFSTTDSYIMRADPPSGRAHVPQAPTP